MVLGLGYTIHSCEQSTLLKIWAPCESLNSDYGRIQRVNFMKLPDWKSSLMCPAQMTKIDPWQGKSS